MLVICLIIFQYFCNNKCRKVIKTRACDLCNNKDQGLRFM